MHLARRPAEQLNGGARPQPLRALSRLPRTPRSADLRNWYVTQESALFKARFRDMAPDQQVEFFRAQVRPLGRLLHTHARPPAALGPARLGLWSCLASPSPLFARHACLHSAPLTILMDCCLSLPYFPRACPTRPSPPRSWTR